MARKRDDTIKLVLRLPPLLHRDLKRAATRNNQSLNSEMIVRLMDSFLHEGRGAELVLTTGGRRYRFVSEDRIEEIKKDSES